MENNQTPPAFRKGVTEKALGAFWEAVAREYPEAEFGDLSPERDAKLLLAAEKAVAEWAANNLPVLCKTCGSDLAEKENESTFNDGECCRCEYRRYASQPFLLDAAHMSLGFVQSWEKTHNVGEPSLLRKTLEAATQQADGNAA